jgi:hypothetical protein
MAHRNRLGCHRSDLHRCLRGERWAFAPPDLNRPVDSVKATANPTKAIAQGTRRQSSSNQEHACQSTSKIPRRFTPCSSKFVDAYHSDAIAEAPSRVTVISKRDLLRDVGRDASEALELARVMAGQVRNLPRLEIRNIRSADQRLLAWLRLKARGNPPRVELDRTWTPVAEQIGLTREAI